MCKAFKMLLNSPIKHNIIILKVILTKNICFSSLFTDHLLIKSAIVSQIFVYRLNCMTNVVITRTYFKVPNDHIYTYLNQRKSASEKGVRDWHSRDD